MRVYPGAAGNVAALRGLDIEVGAGEVVAVVGASGSGSRRCSGSSRASIGRPPGRSNRSASPLERAPEAELVRYRADVGVIDQQYWRSLSPYLTARAAVELPLRLRGWAGGRASRARHGAPGAGGPRRIAATHTPSRLSGGEQQRVAFAAALAPRPALLLADEPTAELDERTAAELVALLQALVRREGATAIVVTHDRLVESMADRIVYVRDGRAIAVRRGGPDAESERIIDASGWLAPPLPPPAPAMAPGRAGRGSDAGGRGRAACRAPTAPARARSTPSRTSTRRSPRAASTSSPARRAPGSRRCCGSSPASTARPPAAS